MRQQLLVNGALLALALGTLGVVWATREAPTTGELAARKDKLLPNYRKDAVSRVVLSQDGRELVLEATNARRVSHRQALARTRRRGNDEPIAGLARASFGVAPGRRRLDRSGWPDWQRARHSARKWPESRKSSGSAAPRPHRRARATPRSSRAAAGPATS